MIASLATPQAVLDARDTVTRSMVLVNGISVQHLSWDARFNVHRATASASIKLSLPRPVNVEPNATVEIIGGHNDFTGTLFSGRLPAWRSSMRRDDTITLFAAGWTSLLAYKERFELTYEGPITLSALFDSLCARRGVPSYRADPVTNADGTIDVVLGGDPAVDDGTVTIPAGTTPLAYLNNQVEQYGYRVYDTPDGTVRLSRISGIPTGTPIVTFTEGWSILGADRDFDIAGIVTYPDIHGETNEDQYGASIPVRAFPSTITASPYVPVNGGVAYEAFRRSLITSQQQAEIALEVAQLDLGAPETPVRWDGVVTPGLSVGDPVALTVPAVEGTGTYWLVGLTMDGPASGELTATYEGWSGTGTTTPPGDDRTRHLLQNGPIHLGDEYLSHYAVPAASAGPAVYPLTLPERATAVNVVGWHHGTNSQVLGGVQTDIEVTKWEVHLVGADREEDGYRPAASGNMPTVAEELALRRPYSRFTVVGDEVTDPGYWVPFAVNLSRLEAGDYTFELIPGVKGGKDDFEVRRVFVDVYGVAEPVIVPQEVS